MFKVAAVARPEGPKLMHLAHYLGLLHRAEIDLAAAFREVGDGARATRPTSTTSRASSRGSATRTPSGSSRSPSATARTRRTSPSGSTPSSSRGTRSGGLGLLRDLHDLYLMAAECDIAWTLVGQAAQGPATTTCSRSCTSCEEETATQLAWLRTRMKQAAPQALVVVAA